MAEADFFAHLLDTDCDEAHGDVSGLSAEAVTMAFGTPASGHIAGAARIDPEWLLGRLQEHGFWMESNCEFSRTVVYARPGFADDLHESLTVETVSPRGNVIQARVGVWYGAHGIVAGHSRLLTEIWPESANGVILLQSAVHARAVEERVARVAPQEARGFAMRHGQELLDRVAPAKAAAAQYVQRLRPAAEPDAALARLLSKATPDQLQQAQRIMETPGMIRIPATRLYNIAALAIAIFGEEVEGTPHPFLTPPLRGSAMLMRVQLIVHQLLAGKK